MGILAALVSHLMISPVSAAPAASAKSCFREHMSEAVILNEARLPVYSKLTNGDSEAISKALILGEKQALFFSRFFYNFDRDAIDYQAKGINIVCDEFVSMSNVPEFSLSAKPYPHLQRYTAIDFGVIRGDLSAALDVSFSRTRKVAKDYIAKLDSIEPRYNCMMRHLLESISRIAMLAPRHIQEAKRLGLASPAKLSRRMIRSHLMVLKNASDLDELAAPIQAAGIPIICQDVPPIPH